MAVQPNQYQAASWRKSSASAGASDCVEVARLDSSVLVRDSGDRLGAVLRLTTAQWRRFTRQVRDGEPRG